MEDKQSDEVSLETVAELTTLNTNPDALKAKIIEKLADESLSFSGLMLLIRTGKIKCLCEMLSAIGLVYRDGNEKIAKNDELACQLFKYTSALGDVQGSYNYATYLYEGNPSEGKDLALGLKLIEALGSRANDIKMLLLKAKIQNALKNYEMAHNTMQYIRRILSNKPNEEQLELANSAQLRMSEICFDIKQNREALRFLRTIQVEKLSAIEQQKYERLKEALDNLLRNKLDEIFPHASEHNLERKEVESGHVTMVESSKKLGWYRLSRQLYGFNRAEVEEQISKESPKYLFSEQKRQKEQLSGGPEKSLRRKREAEELFFNPKRTRSHVTRQLAMQFQANRLASDEKEVDSIQVLGIPTRQLVTAEVATVQASFSTYGYPPGKEWYGSDLGWRVKTSNNSENYSYLETVQMGAVTASSMAPVAHESDNDSLLMEAQYEQRINPHYNHTGDFKMREVGTIRDMYQTLVGLVKRSPCQEEDTIQREKEIASKMLCYMKHGTPITLKELQTIVNENVTSNDVRNLNRIFYHYSVKEISRRQAPKKRTHQLPWALTHARSIQLIEAGCLRFAEVFESDAPYGVFTGKNIGKYIDAVKEKMDCINALYEEFLLKRKRQPEWVGFFKKHPKGTLVSTRYGYREELREAFGGEEDTDGEGYLTDDYEMLSEKVYQSLKQPSAKDAYKIPLLTAVASGDVKAVEQFISAGCPVSTEIDETGNNALLIAARHGKLEVVKLLLPLFEEGEKNVLISLLMMAASNDQLHVVEWLDHYKRVSLKEQDDHGWNALLHAARGGSIETLQWLIEEYVPITSKSKTGMNAIMIAAENNKYGALRWLLANMDINLLEVLAEKNDDGNTALLLAAASARDTSTIVNWLLQAGSSIHEQNNGGDTALTLAAKTGHINTVKMIMEKWGKQLTPEHIKAAHDVAKDNELKLFLLAELDKRNAYDPSIMHPACLFFKTIGSKAGRVQAGDAGTKQDMDRHPASFSPV